MIETDPGTRQQACPLACTDDCPDYPLSIGRWAALNGKIVLRIYS